MDMSHQNDRASKLLQQLKWNAAGAVDDLSCLVRNGRLATGIERAPCWRVCWKTGALCTCASWNSFIGRSFPHLRAWASNCKRGTDSLYGLSEPKRTNRNRRDDDAVFFIRDPPTAGRLRIARSGKAPGKPTDSVTPTETDFLTQCKN